jgi:hypothetical protein
MPMKRYKPEQIVALLRQIAVEMANGKTALQACKEAEITVQTYYRWREELGGLKLDQAKRLKELEKENAKLKRSIKLETRTRNTEAPKPIFRAPAFRCSDWFNRRNPICVSGLTVSRDYLLQFREPVLDAMNRGSPLFLDRDHLSAYGNRVLYPEFVEFLRSHSDVERPGTRTYQSSTAQ